jgi:dipeptidyl aminopeptidase/acylaminoacyl peptidase
MRTFHYMGIASLLLVPLITLAPAYGQQTIPSPGAQSLIEVREPKSYEKHPITLKDILSIREVQEAQIAPDGHAVAFTLKQAFLDLNENRTALFVVNTTVGSKPSRLVESKSIAQIEWRPDSKSIAYLSSVTGSTQLWSVSSNGGNPEQIFRHADATGDIGIQDYHLSPDGSKIAFTCEPAVGADEKKLLEAHGVIYDADTSPLSFRQIENKSWIRRPVQLWIYDLRQQTERMIWDYSNVKGSQSWQVWQLVMSIVWSPDGNRIAVTYTTLPILISPPSPTPNRNIAVIDADSGKTVELLDGMTWGANPAWSPDGQSIAFMSYTEPLTRFPTDKPYVARPRHVSASIFTLNLRDKKPENLTKSFPVSESSLGPGNPDQQLWWSDDGRSIYFMNRLRDRNSLYQVDIGAGQVRAISQSHDDLSAFSFSRDRSLVACIRQNTSMPAEIAVFGVRNGVPTTLTDLNPEYKNVVLGAVTEVTWTNKFGYNTNGFLIKPTNYIEGKRYPLLIILYGFRRQFISQAQWIPNFPAQAFAANGFAVLMMNFPKFKDLRKPDESNAFGHAYNPLASIEAAVQKMIDMGIADPKRKGILGFSYGSFLTDFTITHSNLFEVASSGDGLYLSPGTYWLLFKEAREWLEDTVGGPPYGKSYANWLKFSPALNAQRVRIPLLKEFNGDTLVGGLEFYTALKFNRVPVEYVVYPDEPHIMTQPVHRFYSMQRNLDWFNFWLQNKEDQDPTKREQYERWHHLREMQRHQLKQLPLKSRSGQQYGVQ